MPGWRPVPGVGQGSGGSIVGLGAIALPYGGLLALTSAFNASGLFGFRATTVVAALPQAGLSMLVARWLAQQFFSPLRVNPVPFDFSPTAARPKGFVWSAGWAFCWACRRWRWRFWRPAT